MRGIQRSLVLTILGPDRPGIVELVAQQVAAQEGNWLESSMARLAGKFAGILRVSVPQTKADELTRSLAALEAQGLRVLVEPALEPQEEEPAFAAMHLALVGTDRPGIVRDLSRTLAVRGINVEALDTEVTSAPMSGEPLFQASANLKVPASVDVSELRSALEALSDSLMVDVALRSSE
jgi:glycine cleavage system regulatory protein